MKFVKFGIFALSMGLFIASCGGNESETTETTDTVATETIAPAPEAAPATVDTMSAAPVTADTTTATPAH
jgi:ABC-type glycerol-3-phosphate transport system substrate-binding protein